MTTLEIIVCIIAFISIKENAVQEISYRKSLVLVCHDERYKNSFLDKVDIDFMDRYFDR